MRLFSREFGKPWRIVLVVVGLLVIVGLIYWQRRYLTQSSRDADTFQRTCEIKFEIVGVLDPKSRKSKCREFQSALFKTTGEVEELSSEDISTHLKARAMGVDSQVRFMLFRDPKVLAATVYCYYIFSGSLKLSQLSPQQLAFGVGGFSVLKRDLQGYSQWLKGPDGLACRERVREGLLAEVIDLEQSLSKHVALIGLNPVGAIQKDSTVVSLREDLSRTLNHERIHAVQSVCPSMERLAVSEWSKLNEIQKEEVRRSHPDLNWSIPDVAAREYQAVRHEDDPVALANLIADCQN